MSGGEQGLDVAPETGAVQVVEIVSAATLLDDGKLAERQGQRRLARGCYEQALSLLAGTDAPALAAEAARSIGRTYRDDGDLDAAGEAALLSLAIAEAAGDARGIAHALNLQGSLCQFRGDLDHARALYEQARTVAAQPGDLHLVAMIDQNLGIVSNIRGDLGAALEAYQSALDGYRALGHTEHAGLVLNNMGMLYTDLGRWDEADACLAEASTACETVGNLSAAVMVQVNRAELRIAQEDFAQAKEACDLAFRLGERVEDPRALGEVHKNYGIIFRESHSYRQSDEHLSRAFDLATQTGDLLLLAETAREQAELAWRRQQNQKTLQCLNLAHRTFAQLRARRDLADIRGRMESLETTFLEIVRRWGESIESADQYTQGHCTRVADYACLLAEAAGMDRETLFWFRMGALLHDVGKIVVPAGILNKPGWLTPEERAVMERHPDAGVELLAEVEFPWDIRPMVRHHHERWGGGGYPTGIAGEEIPLSARILCIADVCDALSSERPYRKANSLDKSLEVMSTEMASHFDPELLRLFHDLHQQGKLAEIAGGTQSWALAS
ncbi:MAG: tetratricopeptide repeat protein [Gemmatimonadetes bacterium]|nr:tetratricopeptide repeat protein [Gemmatimonadota bacterium]